MIDLLKNGMSPVFLVGFPRCATSTLTAILSTHPEIIFPEGKSTNFFSTDEYDIGEKYLLDTYFAKRGEEKFFGDANPVHSFLSYVPKRIYEMFPKSKLIFSVRNPIERAYSNWWHNKSVGLENLSFESAVYQELEVLERLDIEDEDYWKDYRLNMLGAKNDWRSNPRFYLLRGYYAIHINRYLKYFSKDQIHCFRYEDFRINSEKEISAVLRFLDVNDSNQMNTSIHKNLAIKNERILSNFRLMTKFGLSGIVPDSLKLQIKKRLYRNLSPTEMSPEILEVVNDYYTGKISESEEIVKTLNKGFHLF
jgi:hypothetical protein